MRALLVTMSFDWNINKRLKNVNVAFIHHDKFKIFIIVIEKLIKHYKNSNSVRDKVYKNYFNNQSLLKVMNVMSLTLN